MRRASTWTSWRSKRSLPTRRRAALKQYRACVDTLERELGQEPEAETTNLYRELVRVPAPPTRGAEPVVPMSIGAGRGVRAEAPLIGRAAELDRALTALPST